VAFVQVIIIPAIKSDYETKCNRQEDEQKFVIAVEFSPQNPYGKAVALFSLKLRFFEVLFFCYLNVYLKYTH